MTELGSQSELSPQDDFEGAVSFIGSDGKKHWMRQCDLDAGIAQARNPEIYKKTQRLKTYRSVQP